MIEHTKYVSAPEYLKPKEYTPTNPDVALQTVGSLLDAWNSDNLGLEACNKQAKSLWDFVSNPQN